MKPRSQTRTERERAPQAPAEPSHAPAGVPSIAEGEAIERALAFVAYASRAVPLTTLLDGLPARIAAVLRAEVVSIYLTEGGGDGLVLRGNMGFSRRAQGRIRLRVGEGLTGLAVARQRPVCVVAAAGATGFRRFEELDEDRFPVFLAVPVVDSDKRALGALVVQRAAHAFVEADVVAATLMTAPIAHAVRRDALLDELRDKPDRRTGGGTRKVTLPGRPMVPGRAIGPVAALRRPAKDRKSPPSADEAKRIAAAFEAVERAVQLLETRARGSHLVGAHNDLANFALIASDSRLRERAVELVEQGRGAAEALSTVAREVTRAATGIVGDPFLAERSRDIEDLCDAVLMLAAPDARAETPAKAVLLGDQITLFDLIVTARAQPVGVVLAQPATPRTEVFLRLLGVPAITGVEGAFRWASPGDVALLDGDHGFLIMNPSRAEVSSLRAWRRAQGDTPSLPGTPLPPASAEKPSAK